MIMVLVWSKTLEWNGVSQGALGSDDLACFVSEESSRQEPRRSEMAFTNLRPAVASAPAADDEQHYLRYFLHYLLILMYKVVAISVSV